MQATIAAINKGGHEVLTFAPSAEASRGVLRAEGFANADTVERLLTDDKMRAQAIAKLPTTWPAKGRVLFVEINGQKSRAYGPKHFTAQSESIDITHDIQEGANLIKFAQLNDQSAWTFAVFERRPYREDFDEAARNLAS